MEIEKQTPSVIARLMGLDELQHKQSNHKQRRVLSEDYLRKSASLGLRLKQSSYGGRSSRMGRLKLPEFKDIFEGQEQQIQCIQTIYMEKETSWSAKKSIRSEKQNFKDAKRVELDERILDLLKCSDTLKNLRSDKEMLLRYLTNRDSLFPNHSHDRLCTNSPLGQSIGFKLSSDPYYRKNEKRWMPWKKAARRNVLRSPQKLEYDSDTFEDLHNDSHNISKMHVKVKNGIPVDDEARDTGNPLIDLEPCKHSFTTSRKSVMENELSTISTEVSRSELGADDNCVNETKAVTPFCSSLFDMKNQEQASYPYSNWSPFTGETMNIGAGRRRMAKKIHVGTTTKCPTIRDMLYSFNQKRPEKAYHLNKPGLCSKFIQNSEKSKLSRPLGVNSKDGMKKDVTNSSRFRSFPAFLNATGNFKSKNQNDAFRIDEYLRREEAVTEAENRFRTQKFSEKEKSKPEDSAFSLEISPSSGYMDLENNQSAEESLLNELGNRLKDKKLSEEISKKSELSGGAISFLDSNSNHHEQKARMIQDELDNSFEECITSKGSGYNPAYKLSVSVKSSASMNEDVVEEIMAVATETVGVNLSRKESNVQQSESADGKVMVKDGISSSEISHTLVGQDSPIGSPEDGPMFSSCFENEPELTSSWRDTHQPSPNSVLYPPYEEEILSDFECFESAGPAGANLIGLWKQLQLLKSDIEDTLSEGPGMMVSSDEGTRDVSDDFSKENGKSVGVLRAKETRDFSYLVDVLDEAGFYDANWEINIDKWHSPECAVNPLVFEVLEQKYGDQISWKKSERRLLFDRINSGLMEILQPCLNIPEWANPLSTWLGTRPRRDVVEEKLWNLLVSQEKEVNKGLSEKAVGGDTGWLKLGDDVDIIVCEIEKFLFDELAEEIGNV